MGRQTPSRAAAGSFCASALQWQDVVLIDPIRFGGWRRGAGDGRKRQDIQTVADVRENLLDDGPILDEREDWLRDPMTETTPNSEPPSQTYLICRALARAASIRGAG